MPPTLSSSTERNGTKLSSGLELKLTINEKSYTLGPDVSPETTLLRFIRDYATLKGTKSLCYEGGCGLCTVVATFTDPESKELKSKCLRSCQTLVYSCIGWSITTIEHLGDRYTGYDKLQVALHGFYGTQCGYCTPGIIMTMKGQLESSKGLTAKQIERSFDGNICRCTGYRPILDAFKSFASDAPEHLANKLKDIEDVYETICKKTGLKCGGECGNKSKICSKGTFVPRTKFSLKIEGVDWHYPKTINDVFEILEGKNTDKRIRFVVGNTGQGVFKNDGPYNIYVNTTGIKLLYEVTLQPTLAIGANVSLSRCIEIFHEAANNYEGYHHLSEIARHWEVVANTGVRNMGSWAGNIRMKYDHHEFSSDIFLTLVALDARLKIGKSDGNVIKVSPEEFLSTDMNKSLILSVNIPPQPANVVLRSYKITPRAVNAHAYVNACFRFHLDAEEPRVINRPVIVFGGISPTFVHASNTEEFLIGKVLSNVDDVKQAIQILGKEVEPQHAYSDALPEFRRNLSQCLLYKTIINIIGHTVSSDIRSAGPKLERPVSSSEQKYDANEDTWPVGKPIEKLESRFQISGEAEYLDDIPSLPGELHGYFVQSTIGRGNIKSIDASKCLEMPGVVDFITAKDIPGKNAILVFQTKLGNDQVFAETEIKFHGQAIGLVVAETREIAKEASKLVTVTYENVLKPILTIKEAMETEGRYHKTPHYFPPHGTDPVVSGDIEVGFKNSDHIVEGEISLGGQCHFTMEPYAGRTIPTEEGYDLWCTTQWASETVNAVAANLGISVNRINISIRRLGGGYGGKISRANITASASAIAAHKLKKPVRVALDLSSQMTLVGWREPYYSKYKVGFSNEGLLQAISADVCSDVGNLSSENSCFMAVEALPNVYYCPNWKIQGYYAITNTPPNTWCRAPGHVQATGILENIIERVAFELQKDPLEIREMNFISEEKPDFLSERNGENLVQTTIIPLLKTQAEIAARRNEILKFNKENKWKKRGMSVIPLHFPLFMYPFFVYNVQVVIYEYDGTVAIKHGGVEMGQGINTKIAQVAANILDIPLDLIKIKSHDNFVSANSVFTAASRTSDLNAHGVIICCEKLRSRINEIAEKHDIKRHVSTWPSLIKKCFEEQIDLSERYFTMSKEHPNSYDIWGVTCTEVELDVLTGQFLILRCDIIEDCGRSLNPFVDVGQVEGSFVMGLGFFTTEEIKYNPETGQRLADGTWRYKPPSALDIPIDFRVSFLPKGDNEGGVVGSKATGEPPLCMSYSVVTALRQAIASKRLDDGKTEWFEMDIPVTVERIHKLCEIDSEQLIF